MVIIYLKQNMIRDHQEFIQQEPGGFLQILTSVRFFCFLLFIEEKSKQTLVIVIILPVFVFTHSNSKIQTLDCQPIFIRIFTMND